MNSIETPNLNLALKLGMGGSFLGFCLAVHFLLLYFSPSSIISLQHVLIVAMLGILITLGTVIFGLYYLILISLLKAFRKEGDPVWVVFVLPPTAFGISFITLHGFWKVWLWL